jgi:ketosteroid isomerase-like protein
MAGTDLLALIKKLDDAIAQRDVKTLREQVFTPRAEWAVPGRHPLAGLKQGPDEIAAYHDLLRRAGVMLESKAIDAIDERTVARIQHATGHAAGFTLDSMELLVYEFHDGRISRIQSFLGDQHPVDLFYWHALPLKPIPDRLSA